MEGVINTIEEVFRRDIVDPGRLPQLFLLSAFLLTFGFIRFSTHMIKRNVSWWPGNIQTKDGLHIHHLVFGIILILVVGYLAIGFYPSTPTREVFAVLFGIGIGLTLDEFALWLNLKDVYWAEQGRQSIDAVIIAATLAAMLLIGLNFWVDLGQEAVVELLDVGSPRDQLGGGLVVASVQLINLSFAVVCFLKGKFLTAAVGLFIPLVALVGSVRKAKPNSRWIRRQKD